MNAEFATCECILAVTPSALLCRIVTNKLTGTFLQRYNMFCLKMAGKFSNLRLKQRAMVAVLEKVSRITTNEARSTLRCRMSN